MKRTPPAPQPTPPEKVMTKREHRMDLVMRIIGILNDASKTDQIDGGEKKYVLEIATVLLPLYDDDDRPFAGNSSFDGTYYDLPVSAEDVPAPSPESGPPDPGLER